MWLEFPRFNSGVFLVFAGFFWRNYAISCPSLVTSASDQLTYDGRGLGQGEIMSPSRMANVDFNLWRRGSDLRKLWGGFIFWVRIIQSF